jgi:hypothetical protein
MIAKRAPHSKESCFPAPVAGDGRRLRSTTLFDCPSGFANQDKIDYRQGLKTLGVYRVVSAEIEGGLLGFLFYLGVADVVEHVTDDSSQLLAIFHVEPAGCYCRGSQAQATGYKG